MKKLDDMIQTGKERKINKLFLVQWGKERSIVYTDETILIMDNQHLMNLDERGLIL
ncbi:MAG TPA: hypothetical protein VK071_05220 [Tissierellales bacterium]|nr:hypothetical protein [Tissierellales bacterium]